MKRSIPCLLAFAPLLVTALAGAGDRPHFDASYAAKARAAAAPPAAKAPPAFVASTDARAGAPTFVWAARNVGQGIGRVPGMTAELAARSHLERHAALYGLTREAMATARVQQIHDTGRGGIIVVLRQAPGGVELFRNDVKVLLDRNLDLVAIGGNLHPAAVPSPKGAVFSRTAPEAIASALSDLHGLAVASGDLVREKDGEGGYRRYALDSASSLAKKGFAFGMPARAKRVYFPLGDRLVPAHFVEVMSGEATSTTSLAYAYVFAADDGRLLYRENLTHADAFTYRVHAEPTGDLRPTDGPIVDFSPHPTGKPDASYPDYAAPSLVSIDGFNQFKDVWLSAAATQTKGNNVDAYTDDGAPDGFSSKDVRATLTSPGVFDYTYDPTLGPQSSDAQRMAAVTNLFYVTNWLHDWWYDSGFDEAAGNAQGSNFGRGGLGGDVLHAEGQDGAPGKRNNANMSVFADGASPRMQMYVWDGKSTSMLGIQPLNANYPTSVADFGPPSFNVMGQVALVHDGNNPVTDACEAIVNDVSGKIALLDRGTCSFKSKVQRAESAGAIAVILANNVPNEPPPPMGGNGPGAVSIPVLSVTLTDGNALKAALMSGPVTATLSRSGAPDRDGTIDNMVIAHEWGHYIHLRQVACGSAACAAESEGWGDFFALHTMVREGDPIDGAFPAAVYAVAANPDDPGYFGIRRYPYSTDFKKNALTFKHIADNQALPAGVPVAQVTSFVFNSESHAAGEVWASMLFEAYAALIEQSLGPTPKYTFDEARRRMGDYVEAGLKLAPTDPTYTEQRDAILAAAAASDAGDLEVMAEAFARRGAGTCAESPPRDSQDFTGVKESFTIQPNLAIVSIAIDESVKSCDEDGHLDAEETGKVTVTLMNGSTTGVPGASATVSSTTAGLSFPSGATLTFGPIPPLATATATIDVSLDATLTKMTTADLKVDLVNAVTCGATSASIHPLVNFDQIDASSQLDTVESDGTTWNPTGNGADLVWSRRESKPGNRVWAGVDYPSPSDTQLVSPAVIVSDTESFVLTFDHRHSFEQSDGIHWDGSVIEISISGGAWKDISTYGEPGYGGEIGDPTNGAQNTLKGRNGYVGTSAGWPALETVQIDMGTKLAGQNVRLRFRIGTDDAAGDAGWELDNIQLDGITTTPFAAIVDDKGTCGSPPVANAGVDQTVTSSAVVQLDGQKSADPDGTPLTFAWKEITAAGVALSDATSATPTFTAPKVTEPVTLTFELTVSDGSGSATDTVDVIVTPGGSIESDAGAGGDAGHGPAQAASGGCACDVAGSSNDTGAAASLLALIGLAALRRRRRNRFMNDFGGF